MSRYRCGQCGRSYPEDDTARVPGRRLGNYRRAMASAMRRVCRSCTQATVEYVRTAQAEGRNTPLDDAHVMWSEAARALGIGVGDLWRNEYDRRRLQADAPPPRERPMSDPTTEPCAPASPIATPPADATYPGWTDHGCPVCLGYGEHMPGDVLRQCSCCHGWGGWWKHEATGTLAAYPGGPLMGREPVERS